MKSPCGEKVGFHLKPFCGFGSDFVCAKLSGISVLFFDLIVISTVKCNNSVSFLSCFLPSSLTTSFFSVKTNCCVFEVFRVCI